MWKCGSVEVWKVEMWKCGTDPKENREKSPQTQKPGQGTAWA